ncbi:trypsin-like serine protease [Carnobacterium sp. PL17RED31]|nr:trypsin-like serine protease [Carnobacterium sp. PL17RED31]
MRIQEFESFKDIADALGIKSGHLRKLLFEERNNLYSDFEIPKKDGSLRKIYSPSKKLLFIQRRLLLILENSIKVHPQAYGFVKGKGTVSNASLHLRKNYLLNIDLKDFFPNITSGRVRSMFLNYFKLNNTVASTLTNLCCHPKGFLPQGAPTSPIISNILCKTLDRNLDRLAKNSFGSSYSRYADDISFSSNRPFKENIVSEQNGNVILGSSLLDIISSNGFKINLDKVRLQKNHQHQEVTGIVVNDRLNLDRRYIRRVRAMLHSIEVNIDDLSIPTKKFEESNYKGNTFDNLLMVIKGMIDYIGMVRGKADNIYEKLAVKFNYILELLELDNIKPLFITEKIENNVCVIKFKKIFLFKTDFSEMVELDYGQGSGFLLKSYGIVTNYHVVEGLIESGFLNGFPKSTNEFYIETFFGKHSSKIVKAKINKYSKEKDLVLLIPEDLSLLDKGLDISTDALNLNEEIRLLGYPEFYEGDELKNELGNYLRTVVDNVEGNSIKKYELNTMIFAGNSGGPVINSDGKVIGVATEGRKIETNRAVPIDYIKTLQSLDI